MNDKNSFAEIGGKIRFQRKSAKLTQAELGMRAFNLNENAAQVRIKNFEFSIGRPPTQKEIKSICAVLGIDIECLLKSDEAKPVHKISLDVRITESFPWLTEYISMANLAIEQDDIHLVMRIASRVAERLQESIRKWADDNKKI